MRLLICISACVVLAISSGCQTDNQRKSDIDVRTPAEKSQAKTEEIDASAKRIDDSAANIADILAPEIPAGVGSELDSIGKNTAKIRTYTDFIRLQMKTVQEQASHIDSIQQENSRLQEKVAQLQQGIAKERARWLTRLQIAGIVIIAGGVILAGVIGYTAKSVSLGGKIGLPVMAGGATLTLTARVWQDYAWILSLVAAALVLAGIAYLVYLAVADRKELLEWWEKYGE